jgi:hypothetical protein
MPRGSSPKRERQREYEELKEEIGLSIARYEHLSVTQISARLHGLSYTQLRALERHERAHKNRSTLLRLLQRRILH